MNKLLKTQSAPRIIASGFALVIFIGSLLLMLPCSIQPGTHLNYIDALYTSTSAVCVTGLTVVDAGDTFTALGQFFLAVLIQIGGLGVTSISAGVILAMGRRVNLKGRMLIRESMNLDAGRGLIGFVYTVFKTTLLIELIGAALSFIVFIQDYSLFRAIGVSLFHSVASFNNAGFDIFGGGQSMVLYADNIFLNIITCVLIFFGGIGFLVIQELWQKKCQWKKLSMHTKVVLSVSLTLIIIGTLLIKLTEPVSWLCALFHSVSTRTAGFASRPIGDFGAPALLVMIVLMFIGASSGSTGGGIKTSTFFVLIRGIFSAATNQSEKAFHYSIPKDAFKKAAVISILAAGVVITSTYILMILEPQVDLLDALFEMTSAFSTAGLSTGISSGLHLPAKILSIMMMFTGRLGPLTIASLWYFSRGELALYPDGNIVVG